AVTLAASVHSLDAGEQMHVDRRGRRPSAAQADFAARSQGVIDRGDCAHACGAFEQCVHIRNCAAIETEVDVIGAAEKVDVALKGRDFAAGNQEQLVEVRLQLAHRIVLRTGIVIGNGDEVESAAGGGIHGKKERAGNHFSGLSGALAVTV